MVLMRDLSREPSPDLRLFGVLCLDSHGIFMAERMVPMTRRPPSLIPVPHLNSGTVTTHGGLISPQTSESQFSATNNGFKPIDPSKVRDAHHSFGYRSCRNVCGFFFSPSFSYMLIPLSDSQPLHKRECAPAFGSPWCPAKKLIDGDVRTLETPPPCNEFYLMNCTVRSICSLPVSIVLIEPLGFQKGVRNSLPDFSWHEAEQ